MRRVADALYSIVIALWVGGLWAIGGMAAPMLFKKLADITLAGVLAGTLFNYIAWFGLGAGVFLLGYLYVRRGAAAMKQPVFWVVLLMLLITIAGHFGIQPVLAQIKAEGLPREVTEALARTRFATWHGIASGRYVVQSLRGLSPVVIPEKGKR